MVTYAPQQHLRRRHAPMRCNFQHDGMLAERRVVLPQGAIGLHEDTLVLAAEEGPKGPLREEGVDLHLFLGLCKWVKRSI